MLEKVIEKTFNISPHEFQRTAYSWLIRLLYRTGYVLGWTTLVAMFVSRFSIQWLPVLFFIQAVLTMLGMGLFSLLHERFSAKTLIALCAFATGLLLFLSTLVIGHVWLFFSLLFLAVGIFIPQLTIFLANYIEDIFTPLEGERIFPVIESAETIGGILGGLLMSSFSSFIVSYKFFYLWIIFLFLMVGVVFFLQPASASYHHFFQKSSKQPSPGGANSALLHKSISQIKFVPFLQGLLLIFLIYWIVAQLLEFQYTKVVDEAVLAIGGPETHEQGLTRGLGSLQMLFHGSALIMQLLIASRILKKLGTVGAFLLHALVAFFSAVSLFFGFSYFTVVLAKNNFEFTGVVHKNAYENAYYAFRHGTQRALREFFEAFIYPIGTIVGTFLIMGLHFFMLANHVFLMMQIILVFLTFLMVIFCLRLQRSYTDLSKENLFHSKHQLSRLHAVEILSQKGHRHSLQIMLSALEKPLQSKEVKVKILETLGKFHQLDTLPAILAFFHHKDQELVLAAVKAVEGFSFLHKDKVLPVFSRHRVDNSLRDLFLTTKDEKIRSAIIQVLAPRPGGADFLLSEMKTASPAIKAACIKACVFFADPMATFYLEPFLKDKNPMIKAQAILSLWKLRYQHKRLKTLINGMLQSPKREDVLAVCSIIGDIGYVKAKKDLITHLTVLDPELRLFASFSLLKLGYRDAGKYLAHLLFSKNSVVLDKAKELLQDLKPELKHMIGKLIHKEISFKMHKIFTMKNIIPAYDPGLLERFKQAYLCVDAYEEADALNTLINKQSY